MTHSTKIDFIVSKRNDPCRRRCWQVGGLIRRRKYYFLFSQRLSERTLRNRSWPLAERFSLC